MPIAQPDHDHDAAVKWSKFDRALTVRAETRTQLADKLRLADWALTERGCPEEAALMVASAIKDLEAL